MVATEPNRLGRSELPKALTLIDCDVHHQYKDEKELLPYLPREHQERILDFGLGLGGPGYQNQIWKGTRADLWRPDQADTWRDDKDVPGANPDNFREHLLDRYGVDYAVLTGGNLYGVVAQPDADYAAALARAHNDWTADKWLAFDPRFKASITIAPQDPELAAAEIDRLGEHPGLCAGDHARRCPRAVRTATIPSDLRGGRAPRTADLYPFWRRGRRASIRRRRPAGTRPITSRCAWRDRRSRWPTS